MKNLLAVLLILQVIYSYADVEKAIESKITKVTVFTNGAQVTREGRVELSLGRNTLILKNLSPFIDKTSIQVRGEGEFTILSVNHQLNYLSEVDKTKEVQALTSALADLQTKKEDEIARIDILNSKLAFLDENKAFSGKDKIVTPEVYKGITDLYFANVEKIKLEILERRRKINQYEKDEQKVQRQLSELNNRKESTTGEIYVTISSPAITSGKVIISYIAGNAGWFPGYDIRVDNIGRPVSLVYKATVYQNTQERWENVKLKFSNANPSVSGNAKSLLPFYLSFQNYAAPRINYNMPLSVVGDVQGQVVDASGQPLPGVNVLVKNTTLGTVSDVNGHFSLKMPHASNVLVFSFIGFVTEEIPVTGSAMRVQMTEDVKQLSEVVVVGYGTSSAPARRERIDKAKSNTSVPVPVQQVENKTTVEFDIDIPYTIASDGKQLVIEMQSLEVPVTYEYYAVPKLEKAAFLYAKIVDWEKYNLLEGEANLYYENTYVGKTVLDVKFLSDTLSLSLGRDNNIVVTRDKIKDYTSKRIIGSQKTETRTYEIGIRNSRSQEIKIKIVDQLPVSNEKEIEVEKLDIAGGNVVDATGEVSWLLNIQPKQTQKLKLGYAVKFPKDRNLYIE